MVREGVKKAGAVIFWLLVWQLAAMIVNRNLLLPIPSPVTTVGALLRFLGQRTFYLTVGASLLRISVGFLLALLVGSLCAFFSARSEFFHTLTLPLLQLIRAIPVASFTILVFLWVSREHIPSSITFFTVLPIVWANIESALRSEDQTLVEMARVFGMPHGRILREITLPAIRPHFTAAVASGLGFAWKSGVAAEVICRTQRSLGDLLWSSKSSVAYDEVFALTLVIVLCSTILQAVAGWLLKRGRAE